MSKRLVRPHIHVTNTGAHDVTLLANTGWSANKPSPSWIGSAGVTHGADGFAFASPSQHKEDCHVDVFSVQLNKFLARRSEGINLDLVSLGENGDPKLSTDLSRLTTD
jgi:hypothetical protein